jgi:SNF2 family DNA or RNA helicase
VDGEAPKKKVTRLKPPPDALSLQDRLFYLLQPPLESWLAGQELIMPFEPFSYQYEGIAWLFSSQSALLADEMGLGKTHADDHGDSAVAAERSGAGESC